MLGLGYRLEELLLDDVFFDIVVAGRRMPKLFQAVDYALTARFWLLYFEKNVGDNAT